MHSHEMKAPTAARHLSHLNFLFTGWGSRVYDQTMVRLTSRLYQQAIEDMASLQFVEGKALDVGTGPGALARNIARRFPQLQVYGLDLSEAMIQLAQQHAKRKQVEERVHFTVGDVARLPYPDHSFDLVVSTISLHHWHALEQPFRELYRVLRPEGRVWIYDARFIKAEMIETALASTPFAGKRLECQLVKTGFWPFAVYKRFALQK